jgi:hypothetical protein
MIDCRGHAKCRDGSTSGERLRRHGLRHRRAPYLTAECAEAYGVTLVSQDELLAPSNILTIHLVLGDRSRGLIGAGELAQIPPGGQKISEIHLDSALRMVTQDAIVYRLESIAKQLQSLEQKYGMSFEQFDERFQAKELTNPYSYEVEQDYLEWEGLLCRKRRLQEVRDWLR